MHGSFGSLIALIRKCLYNFYWALKINPKNFRCDYVTQSSVCYLLCVALYLSRYSSERPTDRTERKKDRRKKKDLKQKKGMNDLYSEFLFMTYGLTQHRTESNRMKCRGAEQNLTMHWRKFSAFFYSFCPTRHANTYWNAKGTCSPVTTHLLGKASSNDIKRFECRSIKIIKWRWDENSSSPWSLSGRAAAKTLARKEITQMKWPNYILSMHRHSRWKH